MFKNTCCYNSTYSFLTVEEKVRWPTVWKWREDVLNVHLGEDMLVVHDTLGHFGGLQVYGQKTVIEYVNFMKTRNASGGPML